MAQHEYKEASADVHTDADQLAVFCVFVLQV
jgi:hypothetical protein